MNIADIGSVYMQEAQIPFSGTRTDTTQRANSFASLLDEAAAKEHAGPKKIEIDRDSKLYEQCRELETFIVKSMLSGMRKTVMKSEINDTGFAGKMYDDMLYDEYAVLMTKSSGFGLADQAYLELSGASLRK